MHCDRILSIFPNVTLKLANYSKLKDGAYAAKLMEGVSPNVPMRSGVLGVFSIVLEFCGYAALAAYAYQKARCTAQFCSPERRSRASSAPRIT